MGIHVLTVLLWAVAISSGLMAGIYFAFSAFLMRAFNNLSASEAIRAMKAVNATILRSAFLPLFFGSSLLAFLLAGAGIFRLSGISAVVSVTAGLSYFVGMFISTIVFNVPLNNQLDVVEPGSPSAPTEWNMYYKIWTRWNHLRTVASLTSFVLSLTALLIR